MRAPWVMGVPVGHLRRRGDERTPSAGTPGTPGTPRPDPARPAPVPLGNAAFSRLVQRSAGTGAGPLRPDVGDAIAAERGGGAPLPAAVGGEFGERFGVDLSAVRLHTGETADALNRSVQARAFTTGTDIFFSRGSYDPGSTTGRELLAHELTHVVQQSAGTTGGARVSDPSDAAEVQARQVARLLTAPDRDAAGNRALTRALDPASPAAAVHRSGDAPHVQRDLGTLAGPQSLTGAAAIIPVATFIADVEAVERANPTDTAQEVLSRIRVRWYSGVAFDQLIPRARTADILPNFSPGSSGVSVVPRDLGQVDEQTRARLTAHADENRAGDNPSPYIALPSGEQIDVGHLFLTADALLHPETSAPYSAYHVPNIDPASWAADVGIASVWLTMAEQGTPHSDAPSNPSPPTAEAYWRMSAPEQDLLGDVDGFALQTQMSAQPQRLSESLRALYLGQAATAPGTSRRFQRFCAANGLTYRRNGASVTWDTGWRAATVDRIDRFNDLYGAGSAGAAWGTLFGPTPRSWPHTGAMLDRFLNWLKPRLEAELRTP